MIGEQPALLDVPGPVGRVATPISWEIFFPDRTREGVEAGGRLVLNPTNGSSFTGTIVQTQQVASSRMRAIETGRWVAQVAPTGFTAVIDDEGHVLERSRIGEQVVIQREVELREGLTIYTRLREPRGPSRCRCVLIAARLGRGADAGSPRSIVVVTCTASRNARSCVTSRSGAVEAVQRRLELLDRLEVEVVGRLVEHQAVDALGHELGEQGAGALARREVGARPVDVVGAEPELGQQRAGLAAVEARSWP